MSHIHGLFGKLYSVVGPVVKALTGYPWDKFCLPGGSI